MINCSSKNPTQPDTTGVAEKILKGLNIVCYFQLRTFTFTIGFAMSFGALFSKTWRVYRIFANKKLLHIVSKTGIYQSVIHLSKFRSVLDDGVIIK